MTKIKIILIMLTCFQFSYSNVKDSCYIEVFNKLKDVILDKDTISFKDAVFIVENAYFGNKLDKSLYDEMISTYLEISSNIKTSHKLLYNESDKPKVSVMAANFKVMTDSTFINLYDSTLYLFEPLEYDFNDIAGKKKWENMFVNKLLATKKGNCHSLPYLYKILCDESGVDVYLAFAPNHIYIKQKCKKYGWFNTELTNKMFPKDSWLMASGYIHLDAIKNGIYMKPLSYSETICSCLVDLAQGYKSKYGTDKFVIDICDFILEKHPEYINALILKAESEFQLLSNNNDIKPVEMKNKLADAEKTYAKIYKLGYRQMPEKMYIQWLKSLKKEVEKYNNNLKF